MAILILSPNGTSAPETTLEAARTANDAVGKTVFITSALTQAQSNISGAWPANIALKIGEGGSIANSTTFTINGPFSADNHQVFSGAGSVVFNSDIVNPNGWFAAGQSVTFNAGLKGLPSLISTGLVLGGTAKVSEVYPEWFIDNASPGTTNTTTAINAAISAINGLGGGKVYTSLAQLITSPILMKPGVQLEINNTLNCSGMTTQGGTEVTNSAVLFIGQSVLTSVLTVSSAINDTTVTVASSTGIVAGDNIVVEDNYNFGRLPTITGIGVNSHLGKVLLVAGNVLTIDNPLPTAFPSATSQVRKVILVENSTVKINNIAGQPYQGVSFQWSRHCKMADTSVNPIGKNGVYFHAAFGNLATNIIGINPPTNTGSPMGYGAEFDFGAEDNTLENSYFEGIREIALAEYARRNTVSNVRIIKPFDSGVNTHGLAAQNNIVEKVYVLNPAQYGFAIGQITSGFAVDTGNIFRLSTIIGAGNYGIREIQFSSSTVHTDTIYDGNTIIGGATDSLYIGGSGTATDLVNSIARNNKIIDSGGSAIVFDTVSVNAASAIGNDIRNSAASGIFFSAPGSGNIAQNNSISNSGTYGIRNFAVGPRILIDNNNVEGSGIANYLNIGLAMPTSGFWVIGDRMPYYGSGATPLNGWRRITTGSNNVLNTDWVAN